MHVYQTCSDEFLLISYVYKQSHVNPINTCTSEYVLICSHMWGDSFSSFAYEYHININKGIQDTLDCRVPRLVLHIKALIKYKKKVMFRIVNTEWRPLSSNYYMPFQTSSNALTQQKPSMFVMTENPCNEHNPARVSPPTAGCTSLQ